MMDFKIKEEEFLKFNISKGCLFYLMSVYFESGIVNNDFVTLWSKKLLDFDKFDNRGFPVNPRITQEGVDIIESIFLNSEIPSTPKEDPLEVIANSMRDLYPKGRKEGTNLMWKDSTPLIVKRLKTIIKKYNVVLDVDKTIKATQRYIESFNGDYRYMQVLKYFIMKQVNVGGIIEEHSQLLSYLENEGQEDTHTENWTSNLN